MANIIIALSGPEESNGIRSVLARCGYRSVFICANGAQAISKMDDLDDAIVICSYKLQDMMYSQLRENLPYGFDMLLLVSQKHVNDLDGNGIVTLTMPLKVDRLMNTLNQMVDEQIRRKKRDRLKPKTRSEEDIKILNEAKALLMARNHITEAEAHKYIQKNSMETGSGLVETAKKVLTLMKDR
ncbi:MAG: ANTAR domain-containing protein [Lachnospiraceae bacterium]|nr:ANTAR domain-containing protein [Lachnospiraceae bacterium]